jgi:hypothetical protein
MIKELTKENEAAMPLYVEKWIKIGTNTERLDYEKTVSIINPFLTEILKSEIVPVVIFPNPIEAWVACNFAEQGVKPNDLKKKVQQFFNKEIKIALENYSNPYLDGCFSAQIFAFYDFIINELKVPIENSLLRKYKIWEATSELGLIFPLSSVCIVTEKPKVIKLNENKVLHCDGGPALQYEGLGDLTIYSLNGVNVDKHLAVTRSHDLTIEYYHSLKNADVKTEFVRKYGVERMLELGKKLDSYENYDDEWIKRSEYELWDMKSLFETVPYAPHLKMMNQTTKVWHVEAVSPSCLNIKDALKERFGGDFKIRAIA